MAAVPSSSSRSFADALKGVSGVSPSSPSSSNLKSSYLAYPPRKVGSLSLPLVEICFPSLLKKPLNLLFLSNLPSSGNFLMVVRLVGSLLLLDGPTTGWSRLELARVLVEIDISAPRVEFVKIKVGEDVIVQKKGKGIMPEKADEMSWNTVVRNRAKAVVQKNGGLSKEIDYRQPLDNNNSFEALNVDAVQAQNLGGSINPVPQEIQVYALPDSGGPSFQHYRDFPSDIDDKDFGLEALFRMPVERNHDKRFNQAEKKFVDREKKYDDDPSEENLLELNKANVILARVLAIEEGFWKQKSTCRWLEQDAGKTSWPEHLGVPGEVAVSVISRENSEVNVMTVKEGMMVTLDFRFDRVRVWLDKYGIVKTVPQIG
ncbi:hypothetical protein BUALT_Bualt02G0209000 [Buddleja alternifolia]|uniref:Uncharacterized protein n=1 Tax=Buddleja alternifolia TaxID=168488 RepID=A0AAV6Y830_9LAMI|nr:hypothetical protein BUALT_Bualt02G0209000 [Buddleja alternifolia]